MNMLIFSTDCLVRISNYLLFRKQSSITKLDTASTITSTIIIIVTVKNEHELQ